MKVLAVRLGRLGDLVMVEPALRLLSRYAEVALLVAPRYRELFDRLLPHVEVVTTPVEADVVLDLQRTPASRRALRGVRGRRVRVRKDGLRRRALLVPGLRRLGGGRTWPQRHLEAARRVVGGAGEDAVPRFAPLAPRVPGRLGISPGAGHALKQPGAERLAQIAAGWPGEVVLFAAPWEDIRGIPGQLWERRDLLGLAEGTSTCSYFVAGDTGPLHLAGALGCSLRGIFGPTPVDAGFWVWDGEVERADLWCSPCSLHGRGRCWTGGGCLGSPR